MKNLTLFVIILVLVGMTNPALADEGAKSAKEVFMRSWIESGSRLHLQNEMTTNSNEKRWPEQDFKLNDEQKNGTKSIAKAVLFSAAVPGAGQFYNKSYLKSILFVVLEAATLTGYVHFQNRGNDLESQFERYADQYWSEDVYWDWMANISAIDRSNMAALREFERANFSHFLPEEKSQQYYENIGKYNQFVIGWDDLNFKPENLTYQDYLNSSYNGQNLDTISALREDYTLQRKDANDNFKRATNLITITMLNHVISAIEAGFTAKRRNRRALKANIRFRGMYYYNDIIPSINLGLKW
ncbi:MAG: DUF5683 domain-containing protein [bacterium]